MKQSRGSVFSGDKSAFQVRIADWRDDRDVLSTIRRRVFIQEQNVPEDLEWDEHDDQALHFLVMGADAKAIGCARLLPDGHFGRMAVLADWRNQGAGRALLQAALTEAQTRGHDVIRLSAQRHAAGFYARHGFETTGGEYWEAGIAHVAMEKKLGPVG